MLRRSGIAAALFFVALALTAAASAASSPIVWGTASLALLLVAWLIGRAHGRLTFTPLGAAVFGYATWLVVTNLWVNPYSAAASYDAAFLIAGFMIGWRLRREDLGVFFATVVGFVTVLALWSIAQRLLGTVPRGLASFESPATLAAVLNLVLAPGLVLAFAGRRNRWLVASLVVLALALLGTGSRGGWIALIAAGAVALLLWRRAGLPIAKAVIVVPGAAAAVLGAFLAWHFAFGTAAESGGTRFGLYRAAVDGLSHSSWLFGSGYLQYRYVLEAARPTIPNYVHGTTFFVHNDYLQALLEIGVPGALFLLSIAALPLVQAWRTLPRASADERALMVALAAGMASMAIHALADFPFYVPASLALYGAYAGVLAARNSPAVEARTPSQAGQVVRALVVAAAFWLLAKPMVAESAAYYATREWAAGRPEAAAYWYEAARRIEPKDWRFHGLVGQFWFAQAEAGRNAAAARLADQAFEDGLRMNPREVSNLLGRIRCHFYLRSLLPAPADPATLRRWLDEATGLAPLDPEVERHRRLVLR